MARASELQSTRRCAAVRALRLDGCLQFVQTCVRQHRLTTSRTAARPTPPRLRAAVRVQLRGGGESKTGGPNPHAE